MHRFLPTSMNCSGTDPPRDSQRAPRGSGTLVSSPGPTKLLRLAGNSPKCSMEPFITSFAGVRIPRIISGTAWKKTDTQRLVQIAIQRGFRGIDTACQPKHYHEAGVGAGVAAGLNSGLSRGDLYLQTKFTQLAGQDPRQIPYDPTAALPEQVAQS